MLSGIRQPLSSVAFGDRAIVSQIELYYILLDTIIILYSTLLYSTLLYGWSQPSIAMLVPGCFGARAGIP